ncbi:hypothetical protein [Pedobacter sp. BMA]|uniref:hypothetical protein n=1 Tax=Pedobacter sp. BMA TaxID=1663685 RepID=UPI00064AC1F8|nr:hypothetical protein [Pedobacter sp. BMA]KLT66719.1 hypothetical protein AB669_06020 [Pedobacter sp. BMA]
MIIPPELLIKTPLKGLAARLKPQVYKQDDIYCVLYGETPQNGIFGSGLSISEAIMNWDDNFHKILKDDTKLKSILAKMSPPADVARFLEDYREEARNDSTGYDLNKSF